MSIASMLQMFGLSSLLFLVVVFGPMIAGLLLLRRRRLAHEKQRSPLVEDLLRSPGLSLRARLDQSEEDITEGLVVLMAFPISIVAVGLAVGMMVGTPSMLAAAPMYSIVVVVVIAYYVTKLLRVAKQRDDLRKGYDAELAVGQELDQLMRRGAYVFHDVPADGFNVDHVVIAATGIYAVETKGFSKRSKDGKKGDARVVYDGSALQFPHWTTAEPLEQAERQARWLGEQVAPFLDAPSRVMAIVALPGWYVERTGRGPVRVYNGKELQRLLSARADRPLSAKEVDRVARSVEQRCRTVKPTYSIP